MLHTYFADMHIHVGNDMYNKPVKITASKTLTITNILREASRTKGIPFIGVIDCHAPAVQDELKELIHKQEAYELPDGGIRFEHVTLLLGAEIEVYDEHCQGPIHVLCYLPTLAKMQGFTKWLKQHVTNITLSSQRYYGSAIQLQEKVKEYEGLFLLAHVFTPFKSAYGKGVRTSLTEVFDLHKIDGIEVGLSADIQMADQIKELHPFTYVTNSDAHSLQKIGREYQEIRMKEPSFKEFTLALYQKQGRAFIRHFGLNPKLGKYSHTVCAICGHRMQASDKECPNCHRYKIVKGVTERINELGIKGIEKPNRPPYIYQVPLEYLPGLGPKTYGKLLNRFSTEMNVIHHASYEDLKEVVRPNIAQMIIDMREGKLSIDAGGGGVYGKVKRNKKDSC